MSKIGEMDNQGFRALFNFKVDNAKSKYRETGKTNREERLKNLRAKILSNVKEEILKAIPEVINPFESCIIYSNWIKIGIRNALSFLIEDEQFDSVQLECFFADIAEELTTILGKAVQVDIDNSKFPGNRRFYVKV